jgi:hypothetical protein
MKSNQNLGYHISMGANSQYYILNDGDNFVKNLSLDLEQAKIAAKEKIGFVPPLDIWLRPKYVTPIYAPHTPDWLLFNDHITKYNIHLENVAFNVSKKDCESSQYVGNVGEVLNIELMLTDIFNFDGEYGVSSCYKFKDNDNNRFIYFGTSKQLDCFKNSGDKFVISFEIKRQFIDENHDVAPYKINQITKVKNNQIKFKSYFVQIHNTKIDILDININYNSPKNIKFTFSNYHKNESVFYPSNIKTLKQAKELLNHLVDLNNEGKLSKDYLININN